MKKGNLIWALAFAIICAFLLNPSTQKIFLATTSTHPYFMGFIKFAIMATMGDLLGIRIITGNWNIPSGIVLRSIIWGFIGMLVVLMFKVFAGGVLAAQKSGVLPFYGNAFAFAFFTSSIMNSIFGPTLFAFHRFTDTMIDLRAERGSKVSIKETTETIDWYGYVSFVVLKTIPFFWIPAHTITFLLPSEFRVLVAAFLSIALGAILGFSKKKSSKVPDQTTHSVV